MQHIEITRDVVPDSTIKWAKLLCDSEGKARRNHVHLELTEENE
jgi:hypothetical protein